MFQTKLESKVILLENEKTPSFLEHHSQEQTNEVRWVGLLYLQEESTNQNQTLFSQFSSGSLSQNFSEGACLKSTAENLELSSSKELLRDLKPLKLLIGLMEIKLKERLQIKYLWKRQKYLVF